jgi:hypothetical protein
MSPDLQPTRRFLAGLAALALSVTVLAGCGDSGSSLSDDLRAALGDDLADCLEDNLDDEVIDALNEEGIEVDLMSDATFEAYTTAVTSCQP